MSGSATIARERAMSLVHTDRARAADAAIATSAMRARDDKITVLARAHDAVRPTRQRKLAPDWGSPNRIVGMDAKQLRDSARALCRDHDLARSVLNVLVQNVVGTGIDVIAAPRQAGGDVDADLARRLRTLWSAWWDRPEVTWQHDFGKVQQLLLSHYLRDGESFFQSLLGPVPYLEHGTAVPFSLELLSADLVPLDFTDDSRSILQGAERNTWGRVVAWHVYKRHPGDDGWYSTDTKRVSAEQLRQFAHINDIHQVRGLSIYAPVMNRLVDIQDIEQSERIAAKVAASFCAQIIKGDAGAYPEPEVMSQLLNAAGQAYRSMSMVPGMIGDDLLPGEKIETIASNRPNPNLADYLNDQVRRIAGATGVSHSSTSRRYDGNYGAQRQELVETWGAYAMLGEQFTARVMRPIWADFVRAALLAGQVKLPRGWTFDELASAAFIRPVMPWIDPLKEAYARGEAEDRGWLAPQQSMLQMGNDPDEVQRLRRDWAAQGNPLPAHPSAPPAGTATAMAAGDRAGLRGALIANALKETD